MYRKARGVCVGGWVCGGGGGGRHLILHPAQLGCGACFMFQSGWAASQSQSPGLEPEPEQWWVACLGPATVKSLQTRFLVPAT